MKKTILILTALIFSTAIFARKLDSTALILIDFQNFYFAGGKAELAEPVKAVENAKLVLNYFRENGGLVIHVRHNFQPGGEIHKLVEPAEGEKVISKDEVNAFLNTGLNQYLKVNHITKVVLAGMQTHMCLEAGTRAAHDFGYKCTVIADACATRNLKFKGETVLAKDVHLATLATLKSYGEVVDTNEYLE